MLHLLTVAAIAVLAAALFALLAFRVFRHILALIAPVLTLAVFTISAPGIAHAGFGPVEIGSTIQWLLDNLLLPLLGVLALWGIRIAVSRLASLLHIKLTAQEQDDLNDFADKAVQAGLHRASGAVDEYLSAHPITIDTKNAIANEALSWGLTNLPSMLEKRGITAEKLAPEIEAAMGRLLASQSKPTPPVGPPQDIRPPVDKAPAAPAAS